MERDLSAWKEAEREREREEAWENWWPSISFLPLTRAPKFDAAVWLWEGKVGHTHTHKKSYPYSIFHGRFTVDKRHNESKWERERERERKRKSKVQQTRKSNNEDKWRYTGRNTALVMDTSSSQLASLCCAMSYFYLWFFLSLSFSSSSLSLSLALHPLLLSLSLSLSPFSSLLSLFLSLSLSLSLSFSLSQSLVWHSLTLLPVWQQGSQVTSPRAK